MNWQVGEKGNLGMEKVAKRSLLKQSVANRFFLLLPKVLLMWTIGVISGELVGNLGSRFVLQAFLG
ncbi:MAG: hypothetical protein RMZ95_018245 [Nostoc sp. DedQUE07]